MLGRECPKYACLPAGWSQSPRPGVLTSVRAGQERRSPSGCPQVGPQGPQPGQRWGQGGCLPAVAGRLGGRLPSPSSSHPRLEHPARAPRFSAPTAGHGPGPGSLPRSVVGGLAGGGRGPQQSPALGWEPPVPASSPYARRPHSLPCHVPHACPVPPTPVSSELLPCPLSPASNLIFSDDCLCPRPHSPILWLPPACPDGRHPDLPAWASLVEALLAFGAPPTNA